LHYEKRRRSGFCEHAFYRGGGVNREEGTVIGKEALTSEKKGGADHRVISSKVLPREGGRNSGLLFGRSKKKGIFPLRREAWQVTGEPDLGKKHRC